MQGRFFSKELSKNNWGELNLTKIIIPSKQEILLSRKEAEKYLVTQLIKDLKSPYHCAKCGKKIDPSKPEFILHGKKAKLYHRNCLKKVGGKAGTLVDA